MKPLRIAILTNGRFHVCDLARELAALGHEVAFHSLVSPKRTARFGLPKECNRWMLPKMLVPFARWRLAAKLGDHAKSDRIQLAALPRAAVRSVGPCDVVIAMSGMFTDALPELRRRHGCQIWVERGSRHILSQREIMAALPGAARFPQDAVDRDLRDYAEADTVVVLSRHCERSFLERDFPPAKLFRNPLGVNLKMFQPTPPPPADPPTVIMVGGWSLRKGCDVLVKAWRRLPGVRLMHVGAVLDCPLPTDAGFEHHDPVDQPRLVEYYSKAHVFALASREEGLATVQPQALACGLRLVCTDRTGGEDLGEFIEDKSAVRVTPSDDPAALAEAMRGALTDCAGETGMRERLGTARDVLSWSAYGARYAAALRDRL